MRTSIITVVALATIASSVTAASAQEARHSTKPWLHSRPNNTAVKAKVALATTEATPGAVAQDYSTKSWIAPQREFQIAVFAKDGTAATDQPQSRREPVANPKDYTSKPWLR